MTTSTATATPTFRVHSSGRVRLAVVVGICAALTVGFVREVQRGSAQASAAAADEMASVAVPAHAG